MELLRKAWITLSERRLQLLAWTCDTNGSPVHVTASVVQGSSREALLNYAGSGSGTVLCRQ